jgi:hypothetical protein
MALSQVVALSPKVHFSYESSVSLLILVCICCLQYLLYPASLNPKIDSSLHNKFRPWSSRYTSTTINNSTLPSSNDNKYIHHSPRLSPSNSSHNNSQYSQLCLHCNNTYSNPLNLNIPPLPYIRPLRSNPYNPSSKRSISTTNRWTKPRLL